MYHKLMYSFQSTKQRNWPPQHILIFFFWNHFNIVRNRASNAAGTETQNICPRVDKFWNKGQPRTRVGPGYSLTWAI